MPPYRKPVSLLHTVSLFGCHIRSSKEVLISFLLTWPGIHALVIGTGVTFEKWESRIFHNRSWKFKPCSSKTFPFFFLELLKRKDKVEEHASQKMTHVPKTKKHVLWKKALSQTNGLVGNSWFRFQKNMSQLWRVQGCNSAIHRLPSVNLQTTITTQVTSFWLIIISHPNSVSPGMTDAYLQGSSFLPT